MGRRVASGSDLLQAVVQACDLIFSASDVRSTFDDDLLGPGPIRVVEPTTITCDGGKTPSARNGRIAVQSIGTVPSLECEVACVLEWANSVPLRNGSFHHRGLRTRSRSLENKVQVSEWILHSSKDDLLLSAAPKQTVTRRCWSICTRQQPKTQTVRKKRGSVGWSWWRVIRTCGAKRPNPSTFLM